MPEGFIAFGNVTGLGAGGTVEMEVVSSGAVVDTVQATLSGGAFNINEPAARSDQWPTPFTARFVATRPDGSTFSTVLNGVRERTEADGDGTGTGAGSGAGTGTGNASPWHGIGTATTAPTGTMDGSASHFYSNRNGETLIDGVTVTISGSRRRFIHLQNCNDCTIRNFVAIAPSSWYYDSYGNNAFGAAEPVVIFLDNCTNITIENFNIFGGHRSILAFKCEETVVRRGIIGDYYRHSVMFQDERGDGFVCEDVWATGAEPGTPRAGGSTDTFSAYNCRKPDGTKRHVFRRCIAEYGWNNNGSSHINDGDGGGPGEGGGVNFVDCVGIDPSNTGISIADGRDCTSINAVTFGGPNRPNVASSSSHRASLMYDYKKPGNGRSDYFGGHRLEGTRSLFFTRNGSQTAVRTLLSKITSDTDFAYGHPASDTVDVNCNFNDTSLTRSGVRSAAVTATLAIPAYEIPGRAARSAFVNLY